ncbi:uncharacterized protein LOC120079131 [Benincasa hispida]|uniref:uncharacterized protein LOC120079131 n=1 Tax=Benincasa hispida TaxID=102211 RepID=UPI0019011C32|nr:uncharacterized protein LOC120079131 [Benincasa hispida]
MAPYEALYGRPCRTSICWNEVGERKLLGPELVQQTSDNVKIIRDNLKTTRDRKKCYADKRRRELEFEVELSHISDAFHVVMLRKYVPDPTHVLPEQPVQLRENLSYEEEPVEILDRKEHVLRNKTIPLVKVRTGTDQ